MSSGIPKIQEAGKAQDDLPPPPPPPSPGSSVPVDAFNEQKQTRPPLPHSSDKSPQRFVQQPANIVERNRQESAGEVSCLTEGSPDNAPFQKRAARDVSWDTVPSVQDIHKASPLESEAETEILKAVEQREDPAKASSHLFVGIPKDAVDSFRKASQETPRNDEETSHPNSRVSPRGNVRIKTEDTSTHQPRDEQSLESQLVGLTAAMRLMHKKSDDNETPTSNYRLPTELPEEFTLHDKSSQGQSASLVRNANVLYRRKVPSQKFRRGIFPRQGSIEEEPEEESSSPDNRDDSARSETRSSRRLPVDIEFGENERDDSIKGSKTGRHKLQPGSSIMRRGKKKVGKKVDNIEEDFAFLSDFLRPRRPKIRRRLTNVFFFVLLPLIGTAAILYYGLDNPGLGVQGASTSWLFVFLARHAVVFCLATASQLMLIDFLSLRTFSMVRIIGPFWSLCLVSSKGFPFIMFSHALYAFIMLSGSNRFAKHWLFYQNPIELFNENNTAGTITESSTNFTILSCALVFGITVTIKRVYLGFKFGKRACRNYSDELAKVIQNVLLVGEVGGLAKDLEKGKSEEEIEKRAAVLNYNVQSPDVDIPNYDFDEVASVSFSKDPDSVPNDNRRDRYTGSLSQSQQNEIMGLLGSWEEPENEKKRMEEISMNTILEFRQALTLISNDYPFSVLFGPANTREACIESSQKVYNGLLHCQPDGEQVLHFDTIALLATRKDGEIDHEKMKALIRLFRPNRDGTLTQIEFIKSVDAVYKRLRLLSASISNSGQVDSAAEELFNWAFYILFFVILLSVLGYDPMALFVSLSSIIVAFAFAIGSASAKYFEGLLFVLVRRPYDIGDKIHVSPVDEDTNANGSNTWFVENVDLFTTTIRYATTNEVATVANGSLANSRIINAARSPKMLVYVYMKFGVDVPYRKIQVFRKTVEEFIKQKPRDWLSMSGFRATRVDQELGFIEYVIVLQHRERWQNLVPMLDAKAEFSSFANELAKKLDMPYRAPALPVDLNVGSRDAIVNRARDQVTAEENLAEMRRPSEQTSDTLDMSDLKALFS